MLLRKISIIALLLMLFLTSTSYASVNENTINIDEAKKMALENSRSLKTLELMTSKLKVYSNQAEEAFDDLRYSSYNSLLGEYLMLNKRAEEGDVSVLSRIAILEQQMYALKGTDDQSAIAELYDKKRDTEDSYLDAVASKKDFEIQLEYVVEQHYINILKQEKNLLQSKQAYELKVNLLDVEKLKFQLGISTQDNVDKIRVETSELYNSIIYLKDTIKLLKSQLNDMLGRDFNEELTLTDFSVELSTYVPSYNDLLEKIIRNYAKIPQIERDIKQRNIDLEDKNYQDDNNKAQLVRIEIKEKQQELEEEIIKIKTSIENLIADVKSSQKAYQLAELTYETAKKNHDLERIKYELGINSQIQFNSSQLAFSDAEIKITNALYDYLLADHAIKLAFEGILVK